MHFKIDEEIRDERIRVLNEIKEQIKGDIDLIHVIIQTFKEILSAFLILLVYSIFKDVITMISNYLNNIDFKNSFLTTYFWYIDEKRKNAGQIYLKPLSKAEMKKNSLMSPL